MSKEKSLLSSEEIKVQEKLAILLAFIAGYIDATGLIKWKTYVSFMSGNTTQLGAAFSSEKFGVIITSATVIGSFLIGIYAGTCLSLWKKCRIRVIAFYIVAGILMLYTFINYYCQFSVIPSVAVIGFAMGMMNTIVTSVGNQKVNTDFVTGTLNSLARNTAIFTMSNDENEKKESKANAIHLLLLWIGFVSGAFTSPFLINLLGKWTLLIPAVLLLTCSRLISNSLTPKK
ncbi:YoaK family protein [Epilithonimonas caeni]|uniref:YoaK family protein n=1 Tax=Epilithonimonas caeni TaxID=365343 RepID=UPI000425D3E9|nr:YoaK family protein [Epilithonimonas caeni]